MGDKQRTHIHPFLDPKLAVESIGEVPRVPRAHLEVEFAQTLVRFAPPLVYFPILIVILMVFVRVIAYFANLCDIKALGGESSFN